MRAAHRAASVSTGTSRAKHQPGDRVWCIRTARATPGETSYHQRTSTRSVLIQTERLARPPRSRRRTRAESKAGLPTDAAVDLLVARCTSAGIASDRPLGRQASAVGRRSLFSPNTLLPSLWFATNASVRPRNAGRLLSRERRRQPSDRALRVASSRTCAPGSPVPHARSFGKALVRIPRVVGPCPLALPPNLERPAAAARAIALATNRSPVTASMPEVRRDRFAISSPLRAVHLGAASTQRVRRRVPGGRGGHGPVASLSQVREPI
jgi:hypothetical protein